MKKHMTDDSITDNRFTCYRHSTTDTNETASGVKNLKKYTDAINLKSLLSRINEESDIDDQPALFYDSIKKISIGSESSVIAEVGLMSLINQIEHGLGKEKGNLKTYFDTTMYTL